MSMKIDTQFKSTLTPKQPSLSKHY